VYGEERKKKERKRERERKKERKINKLRIERAIKGCRKVRERGKNEI
jgi:hypothetical protein